MRRRSRTRVRYRTTRCANGDSNTTQPAVEQCSTTPALRSPVESSYPHRVMLSASLMLSIRLLKANPPKLVQGVITPPRAQPPIEWRAHRGNASRTKVHWTVCPKGKHPIPTSSRAHSPVLSRQPAASHSHPPPMEVSHKPKAALDERMTGYPHHLLCRPRSGVSVQVGHASSHTAVWRLSSLEEGVADASCACACPLLEGRSTLACASLDQRYQTPKSPT